MPFAVVVVVAGRPWPGAVGGDGLRLDAIGL